MHPHGLGDYSVSRISDPYMTLLIAGIAGIVIVLVAGLLLGKTMPKKNKLQEKQ